MKLDSSENSVYTISNQITDYLRIEEVLKLGIKKGSKFLTKDLISSCIDTAWGELKNNCFPLAFVNNNKEGQRKVNVKLANKICKANGFLESSNYSLAKFKKADFDRLFPSKYSQRLTGRIGGTCDVYNLYVYNFNEVDQTEIRKFLKEDVCTFSGPRESENYIPLFTSVECK